MGTVDTLANAESMRPSSSASGRRNCASNSRAQSKVAMLAVGLPPRNCERSLLRTSS